MKLDFDVCIPTKRGVPEDLLTSVKKETTGKIYISKSNPLTFARIELISKVETTFFLFLDDDIVYPEGLLQRLYSFFDEKVGAVQGSTIPSGLGTNFDKALSKGRYDSPTSKITRIMTSNALIRTSTVKDWNPTKDVSGIEDMDLTEHIRNKGFLCIVVPQNVKHFTSWKKARRNSEWFGKAYYTMKGTLKTVKEMFKRTAVIGKYILLLPFNPYLSIYTIYQSIFAVIGMIKGLFTGIL